MRVKVQRWGPGQVHPFGCRWCGDERHHHGASYIDGHGVHTWTPPTQDQIKARMKARLRARLSSWPT